MAKEINYTLSSSANSSLKCNVLGKLEKDFMFFLKDQKKSVTIKGEQTGLYQWLTHRVSHCLEYLTKVHKLGTCSNVYETTVARKTETPIGGSSNGFAGLYELPEFRLTEQRVRIDQRGNDPESNNRGHSDSMTEKLRVSNL